MDTTAQIPEAPPSPMDPTLSADVGEPWTTRSRCTDANAGPQNPTLMEAGIPPWKGEEAHRPKPVAGNGHLQGKGDDIRPWTVTRQLLNLSLDSNRDEESIDNTESNMPQHDEVHMQQETKTSPKRPKKMHYDTPPAQSQEQTRGMTCHATHKNGKG